MPPSFATRVRAYSQHLIHTKLWGMDIDRSAWIHPTALIDRTFPAGVHIGAGVQIGEQAVILTHDFARGIYLHTRIGARCNLGPRAIIMPGITLGDDCIVAPGALVIRDMPSGSLAVGNPARIEPRENPIALS